MSDSVVFTAADGTELKLSDLSDTSDQASRNTTNISEDAVTAFNSGVDCGKNNDLTGAQRNFARAIELEPQWPYPRYQQAFTHLLQGDHAAALASYRLVDQLEPRGFFTSKTALNTLERERDGEFPEGLYLYFVSHEWQEEDDDKREVLEDILERANNFSPAYQKLANLTTDHDARLALIDTGLSHQPDVETLGMLLLNKAAITNLKGDEALAIRILGELIVANITTSNVIAIAKAALFSLAQSKQ